MKRWYLFYAQQANPKLEQPVQVLDITAQGMRFSSRELPTAEQLQQKITQLQQMLKAHKLKSGE